MFWALVDKILVYMTNANISLLMYVTNPRPLSRLCHPFFCPTHPLLDGVKASKLENEASIGLGLKNEKSCQN